MHEELRGDVGRLAVAKRPPGRFSVCGCVRFLCPPVQNLNSGGGLWKCQMACWRFEGAAMSAGAAFDSFLASSKSRGESHLAPFASEKPPFDIRGNPPHPPTPQIKDCQVAGSLGRRLRDLARPSCQTSGGEHSQRVHNSRSNQLPF